MAALASGVMPLNVPTACSYGATNAGVCVCVLQVSGRDRKESKSVTGKCGININVSLLECCITLHK